VVFVIIMLLAGVLLALFLVEVTLPLLLQMVVL
jgi:hypothetical protein